MSPSPPHSIEKCWIFSQDSLVASSDRSAVTFRTCQLDLVTVNLVGLSPAMRPVARTRSVDTIAPYAKIAKADASAPVSFLVKRSNLDRKRKGPHVRPRTSCTQTRMKLLRLAKLMANKFLSQKSVPPVSSQIFAYLHVWKVLLSSFVKLINYVGGTRKQIISNNFVETTTSVTHIGYRLKLQCTSRLRNRHTS